MGYFARIDRYLIRNFIPPLLAAIAFFTFIIMLFYLKEVIKDAIEKGLPVSILGELLLNSIGWTLSLTVPMAALLATLIAVGKHNADSEVIALRAAGISYPRIFRPLLFVVLLVAIGQLYLSNEVFPNAKAATEKVIQKIRDFDPTMLLEAGQFTVIDRNAAGERTMYYERESLIQGRQFLENVQIRRVGDIGDGSFGVVELILAERALRVAKEVGEKKTLKALRLYRGYMFTRTGSSSEFRRINFHNGHLDINVQDTEQNSSKERELPEAMTTAVLLEKIGSFQPATPEEEKVMRRYKMEINKRISLPFAVIVLTFLGFPMAVVNRRSGKGQGFGLAIIFIFIYFGLFLSSDTVAVEKDLFHETLAAWFGNLAILSFALVFSQHRLSHETWKERLPWT